MAIEATGLWTFTTSTGAGTALNVRGNGAEHTFYIETSSNCTGSIQILTARSTSSPGVVMSSLTMSSAQTQIIQMTGAFLVFWPRVKTLSTASTNSLTVEYIANDGD